MRTRHLMALALVAHLVSSANAQVYRCEADGKTSYSDAPCLGAKRVDVTPTQGLDKLSGQSRKGKDVRADEFQNSMARAMRPLLGETTEEYKTRHRRHRNALTPAEISECYAIDPRLRRLEEQERSATGEMLKRARRDLLQERQRYRELKC